MRWRKPFHRRQFLSAFFDQAFKHTAVLTTNFNERKIVVWKFRGFVIVLSGENKDFFPQLEKPTCTLVVTLFDFDQLGRSNLHDKRNMEPRRLCRAWRRAVSSRFSVLLSGRSMCSIVGIMHLFDSGGRGEGSWSLKEPTGESSRET